MKRDDDDFFTDCRNENVRLTLNKHTGSSYQAFEMTQFFSYFKIYKDLNLDFLAFKIPHISAIHRYFT